MKTTQRLLRAALILSLVLGAPGVGAQSAKKQEAKGGGGPQESIKVHGRWVIEVRNPDGTLAERREFKNALFIRGALGLVQLLSRNNSMGKWVIIFDGGGSVGAASPCPGGRCFIGEGAASTGFTGDVMVGTDLALVPVAATPALQIKGSGTVPANGTLARVYTSFSLCSNASTPQNPCEWAGPTGFDFTVASAPAKFAAANVVAGQIVQITVTLTFS